MLKLTLKITTDGPPYMQVIKLVCYQVKSKNYCVTASYKGHADVVELLLKYFAKSNLKDKEGCTALYAACAKGHKNVVRILLENNADVNAMNFENLTPLKIG